MIIKCNVYDPPPGVFQGIVWSNSTCNSSLNTNGHGLVYAKDGFEMNKRE